MYYYPSIAMYSLQFSFQCYSLFIIVVIIDDEADEVAEVSGGSTFVFIYLILWHLCFESL